MLNLLSEYVGYQNWAAFKADNPIKPKESVSPNKKKKIPLHYWMWAILGINALLFGLIWYLNTRSQAMQFCFIDADRNRPVQTIIELKILKEGESPIYASTNENGCFSIPANQDKITLVIQSPFHKNDTIVRTINKNHKETVELRTDDYALMLYYLNQAKVEDWERHRQEWDNLVDDDALIYRVWDDAQMGMDVMSKKEFINYMTLPTQSLKHFELIEKKERNGKIVHIKFKSGNDA